jgi:hypothetical protein
MVPIQLKPAKDALQSFPLPEKPVSAIHVKLAAWEDSNKPPVIGIDNWWIRVHRSPEFYQKVKPLLNIGALVKYQQGQGGVLLCELNVPDTEANPENGPKRINLVATLLRNVGAVFSGAKTIVAGAGLTYHPLQLNEICNQFLTKDKGWFTDEASDLAAFPVGENRFAGVTYQVRDFKTSPLPVAISLDGPSERTPLPKTVAGIKVDRTAAALFFLHTWKKTADWKDPGQGDRTPPAVWTYTVHYQDGKSEVVPVRYLDGTGPWLSADPRGLPHAVVAWSAGTAADPAAPHAVVYQMQWTNPRPEVGITTIDVGYDAAVGNQYGVPVVLAITAADAR